MKIAIYQINLDRDTKKVAFRNLGHVKSVDPKIYDKVFEGDTLCEDLEDVFHTFNVNIPADYKGRSLSVSDIVEVKDGNEPGFYFCDSFGFKKIPFSFESYKYVVKTTYSFSEEIEEHQFETLGEAKQFLCDDLANEIRIDLTETGVPIEASTTVDLMTAELANICSDHRNVTKWEILEI